jgi:hypothetical protein
MADEGRIPHKAERELKAGMGAGRTTVGELLDLYESSFLPQIPRSAHKYRQHLAWWREELGAYLVQAVTPQMIAAAKARLQVGTTRRGSRRSNATVNRYVTTLSSVWTWAKSPEVGLAVRHVVREVEPLSEPPGRSHPRARAISRCPRADGAAWLRFSRAVAMEDCFLQLPSHPVRAQAGYAGDGDYAVKIDVSA